MLLRIPIAPRGSCACATATHAVAPLRNVTKSRRFISDQLPLEARRYHVWHGRVGETSQSQGGGPGTASGRGFRLRVPLQSVKEERKFEQRSGYAASPAQLGR